jgi:hypothetical protein
MFDCRFSKRIWQAAASWISSPISKSPTAYLQGMKSSINLIAWEICKETKARVLTNKVVMPMVLMRKIKDESRNWIMAGAKHLGEITFFFTIYFFFFFQVFVGLGHSIFAPVILI